MKRGAPDTPKLRLRRHIACLVLSYIGGMTVGNFLFPFFFGLDEVPTATRVFGMTLVTLILYAPLPLLAMLFIPLLRKTLEARSFTSCAALYLLIPIAAWVTTKDATLVFYGAVLAVPCAFFHYSCLQTKLAAGRTYLKKPAAAFCVAAFSLALCAYPGGQWARQAYYAHLLPPELRTEKPLYKIESIEGFGLGGKSAGFAVYPLPEEFALTLEKEGISALQNLTRASSRQVLMGWIETPMGGNPNWTDPAQRHKERAKTATTPKIEHYLNKPGRKSPITPPQEFADIANAALAARGNFYTYLDWGGGFVVVIPKQRKIIYAHSG
ncbi:MAG TPA: hypothetical protein PLX33_09475 [Alphaproteobacteria bacterium]|nr:hypothetical protein [Alphaproteobacteria bacterium]